MNYSKCNLRLIVLDSVLLLRDKPLAVALREKQQPIIVFFKKIKMFKWLEMMKIYAIQPCSALIYTLMVPLTIGLSSMRTTKHIVYVI